MNMLNRDTDYALRAILYIAGQDGGIVSTADLNRELNLPRPFMRKIFQILQKEGILTSTKGNMGGFVLAKEPSEIYLKDIMRIFQGDIDMAGCFLKEDLCPNRKTCPLRARIRKIEAFVTKEISDVTVETLLQDKK